MRWVCLSKTDTGFVFAKTHSITGSNWDWIVDVVRDEFACDEEDIDCLDTEDGDFVTVLGVPAVQIHHEYVDGYVGHELAQAAE